MADMRTIEMTWAGGLQFTGGRDGGPALMLDGDAKAAPSPVDALVASAAACSGIDIVAILEKMREPLTALTVRTIGTRAEDHPKRITRLQLTYVATGKGLDPAKVRRAAELSTEKYCSVLQSFAKDTEIVWDVEVHAD
jgi:putative redox protein